MLSDPLQAVGRRGWLPVPVLAHAGQAVEARLPGGPSAGAAEPAAGHDHHDALHAGRQGPVSTQSQVPVR